MAPVTVLLNRGFLPAEIEPSDRKLDLKVIFTDLHKTAAALATARNMARGLGARITLLMAQVVPYPLPLYEPDVAIEFTRARARVPEEPEHRHRRNQQSKSIFAATAMKASAKHWHPIR